MQTTKEAHAASGALVTSKAVVAMARVLRLLLLGAVIVGAACSAASLTTHTSSVQIAGLQERVAFVNKYVTFRRTYEALDFAISFEDNGGGLVPGPSDWDVRIVAVVPQQELELWVPAGARPVQPPAGWQESVSTTIPLAGITGWTGDAQRVVGIDRARRTVFYLSSSMPLQN